MANSTVKYTVLGYPVYEASADISAGAAGTIIGTDLVDADHLVRIHAVALQIGTATDFKFTDTNGTQVAATYYDSCIETPNDYGWFEVGYLGRGLVGTVQGHACGVKVNYSLPDSGAVSA